MQKEEIQTAVEEIFRGLMEYRGAAVAGVDENRPLYDDGYGLDSMDTAMLSGMLSERFETDPYMEGQIPQTLGEIVAYYRARSGGELG